MKLSAWEGGSCCKVNGIKRVALAQGHNAAALVAGSTHGSFLSVEFKFLLSSSSFMSTLHYCKYHGKMRGGGGLTQDLLTVNLTKSSKTSR